jgi:ubiquinone/menaquinone biosynthesis C-methylase UbiE
VRCLRCAVALPTSRAEQPDRVCAGCGAPLRVDDLGIDVIPGRQLPRSWGAQAMQSRWLARVYETWWRPLAFGLSTAFGAPRASEEARLVLDRLAGTDGPWLDLSCGPGSFTRELVAQADGRLVFGVDLSRAMLERAHVVAPDAVLVRADAATLPFADGALGAVVNLAALDLYPDPARVVAESARVLASGGRWICSTFVARDRSHANARRSTALESLTGVRKPTLDWLAAAAERAGLYRFGNARFRRYVVAWADKG